MVRSEWMTKRVSWAGLIGLGLGACSPNENVSPSSDPASADTTIAGDKDQTSFTMVFDARTEAPGTNCPAGGVALLSGQDKNRNGILDAGEVTNTKYVCNGVAGTNGTNGLTSLISVKDEPIGTACPTGGKAFSTGLDANANGVLDASEAMTTQYVCNGLNGANGSDGKDGKNSLVVLIPQDVGSEHCADGGQGIYIGLDLDGNGLLAPTEVQNTAFICNGTAGASGLVNQTPEAAGTNCEYGGTRLDSGVDLDKNGTLDAPEVTQTSYACNGAPGATGPAGTSGLNSLVATVPEPAGTNCSTGGVALEVGLDVDSDGVLDADEVQQTSYVCNGGSGVPSDGSGLSVRSTVTQVDALPPVGGEKIELWVDLIDSRRRIASLSVARTGQTLARGDSRRRPCT